jgi:hypothetical protein
MVAVMFNALHKTLKIAETLDNIEDQNGVTRIYGVVSITHGTSISDNGHWLKGFDINGEPLCLISSVRALEHVF